MMYSQRIQASALSQVLVLRVCGSMIDAKHSKFESGTWDIGSETGCEVPWSSRYINLILFHIILILSGINYRHWVYNTTIPARRYIGRVRIRRRATLRGHSECCVLQDRVRVHLSQ